MTVTDITSNDKGYKYFAKNARSISKIRLFRKDSKLCWVRGTRGRGGRGLGRLLDVTELFIDNVTNHVFVGYKTKDESGHFYQYAIIGTLLSSDEEEVA